MSAAPIIVVSGLPRSGTSLVMSMLEAGGVPVLVDAHRPPDESNPRGYFELEAVKATRRDASWTERAPGHAVKVIHALLDALPTSHRYDVLLVERDLGEVVASQGAMLERSGATAGMGVGMGMGMGVDVGTTASERATVQDALDARAATEDVKDALRRQLDAARHGLATRREVRWTPISHRRLVRDPRTAALEIARFLGRELDLEAMAARVDPALHRARAGGVYTG